MLEPEERQAIESAARQLPTLEDVIHWALKLSPPADVVRVQNLDEYTLDVVVSVRPNLHFVFDTS